MEEEKEKTEEQRQTGQQTNAFANKGATSKKQGSTFQLRENEFKRGTKGKRANGRTQSTPLSSMFMRMLCPDESTLFHQATAVPSFCHLGKNRNGRKGEPH